jgi:hypothetical protein
MKRTHMPQVVQTDTSPFGLSGGTIITGNVNQDADAFCFYPLTDCSTVVITAPNIANGPITLSTALAGIPIYGEITNVTMGAGTAVLYSGSYYYP